MAHAYKPRWSDFYENDPKLGPLLPLTSGQKVQLVSGVLPSGESSFFDNRQLHSRGSGINTPFPYPNQSTKNEFKFTTNLNPFSEMFSDEWDYATESHYTKDWVISPDEYIEEQMDSNDLLDFLFYYFSDKDYPKLIEE